MMVRCSVDHGELENDSGRLIPSTFVECVRCGHTTESFGDHDGSLRRCLVLMREGCPRGEANYYSAD